MKVCDVCDLVNGRAFKPSDWGSYGLPIVRIQNLNNEAAPFNYYSGEYNPAHEINNGELLFSWSGTPGTSFGAFRWYRGKGILNQHIYKVVPKIDIDKDYLKYALNGNLSRIISKAHGGVGLQHITKKELNEITLRIVSNDEQRKIVALLNQTQNVIFHRQAQLAKLDELVKCRFVELFGDPIQNKQIYKLHSFTEFAYIDAEMTTDYHKYANYPHIGIDSIEKETGRLIGYRTVAQDGVISGKYLFSPEHLIYSKIRPNLNKVACPDFHGVCSADSYPIRNKSNCNKYYLLYVLRSQWFLDYIVPLSSRTNLPKVNRKQIESFTWPLPPIELQNQFEAFVRRIDKLRFVIQKSLDETQKLFDSLMQEYFD